jgi:hypothetical protein
MDTMQRIKGLNLPPVSVSFEDRFGLGPWQQEDGEPPKIAEATQAKNKGDWLGKVGDVVEVLPDLFCTLFPKQCANGGGRQNQPPIIVQPNKERDWLMVSLLVVLVITMLILILKK